MKISIHNPCKESWSEMQDLGSTRFCASCQKCVTDFTQLSDREMAQIIESQNRSMCGRFKPDQLERALILNDAKQNKYLTALFSMSLASLIGFQNEVQAKPMLPIHASQVPKDTLNPVPNPSKTPESAPKDSILMGGVVQDAENGEPLMGVSIHLQGTQIGGLTDANGKFEWMVSKKDLHSNLIVSSIGHVTKEVVLSNIDINKPLAILLETAEIRLGGYHPKYTLAQKVKYFFRNLFNR